MTVPCRGLPRLALPLPSSPKLLRPSRILPSRLAVWHQPRMALQGPEIFCLSVVILGDGFAASRGRNTSEGTSAWTRGPGITESSYQPESEGASIDGREIESGGKAGAQSAKSHRTWIVPSFGLHGPKSGGYLTYLPSSMNHMMKEGKRPAPRLGSKHCSRPYLEGTMTIRTS